jgi:ribosomal protein L11 methyltransferase
MWRWTRLTSVKWEDAWAERLQFLGPGRVAFISWPGGRAVRMEAFVDEKTARLLVREFGGKITRARLWTGDPVQPRKPLNIRGRLRIFPDAQSLAEWKTGRPRGAGVVVPAGMAFGTGEHATTASCLRMLADAAPGLPPGWRALDAGTGRGILALAAAALGAGRVDGFDFDPACVRIAKANARANRLGNVAITRADVLAWKPEAAYDLVMANLFSDLLIKATPALKRACRRGGVLIFSGVLRDQLGEVRAAIAGSGFRVERTVTRGKWCAGLCHRK